MIAIPMVSDMAISSFVTDLGIGLALFAIALTLSPPKNQTSKTFWSLTFGFLAAVLIVTSFIRLFNWSYWLSLFLLIPIGILFILRWYKEINANSDD